MNHQEQPFDTGVKSASFAPFSDSSNSNGPARTVEPKPFLRRNTGLQKRLIDSRIKKYVPRGGFLTESHDVGEVVNFGAKGAKSGNATKGRQRPASKAPQPRLPVMSARTQGRPRSGGARSAHAASEGGPPMPRLPEQREFREPAMPSRAEESARDSSALPSSRAARREQSAARARACEPERGYAAAARDHCQDENEYVVASAEVYAEEERVQIRRRQTAHHWQEDDLSEDFEALEQRAVLETTARVPAAAAAAARSVAAGNVTARATSQQSSATQWHNGPQHEAQELGGAASCHSPRQTGRHSRGVSAEIDEWPTREVLQQQQQQQQQQQLQQEPQQLHQQQEQEKCGPPTARSRGAVQLGVEIHSATRSEHSISALEQLAQPSPLRPPSPSQRRRFHSPTRHDDEDEDDRRSLQPSQSRQQQPARHVDDRNSQLHPDEYICSHEEEGWQDEGESGGVVLQRRGGRAAPNDATGRANATLAHVHRLQPMAAGAAARSRADGQRPRAPEVEAELVALREEVAKLRAEKGRVKALKGQLERSATFLQEQRASFLKAQEDEKARWDAERAAAAAKLRRDKLAVEKQSRQLLKLPTKKDRAELEAVEALLEHERGEGRAREQRHKLTVERLRRQISDLQEKQADLKAELAWHLEQRQQQRDAASAVPAITEEASENGIIRHSRSSSPGKSPRNNICSDIDRVVKQLPPPQGRQLTATHTQSANPPVSHGIGSMIHAREDGTQQAAVDDGSSLPLSQRGPPLLHRNMHGSHAGPSYPAAAQDGVGRLRWRDDISPQDRTTITNSTQRFQRLSPPHSTTAPSHESEQPSAGAQPITASAESQEALAPSQSGIVSSFGAGSSYLHARPARTAPPVIPEPEYKDTVHADGKRERHFRDGRRLVVFVNGTIREEYPSGLSLVRFTNGDIKKAYKSGLEEYLFAEVNTWQTICSDGTQVFHFETGQAEAHRPDGSKEVLFADGTARKMGADGSEQEVDVSRLCPAVRAPPPTDVPAIIL